MCDLYVKSISSIHCLFGTGSSEWTLEDTIELKNITLPDIKNDVDMSLIYGGEQMLLDPDSGHIDGAVLISPTMSTPAIIHTNVPSAATIQSVKRNLTSANLNKNVLRQKYLVQLDWVSTEDGSHILTVGVGSKILLYSAVSSELAQASQKDSKEQKSRPVRARLQKSKSMVVENFVEEIRWMKIRSIELSTADGLPPLPMHMSWVRDGILVVGMDNEMHIYSQWRGPGEGVDTAGEDTVDNRTLTEQNLHSVSSSASLNLPKFKHSPSTQSIKMASSYSNMSLLGISSSESKKDLQRRRDNKSSKSDLKKSESLTSMHLIQDCGLFEASRLANPVLPQYHPKQLIELLNFGKIRRVKAILAHLVRCIAGSEVSVSLGFSSEEAPGRQRMFSSPRPLSVVGPSSGSESRTITEDTQADFVEICSIPPLPLYALIAADTEVTSYIDAKAKATLHTAPAATSNEPDYSTLFDADVNIDDDDDMDDNAFDSGDDEGDVFSSSVRPRDRRKSSNNITQSTNYFGPAQSTLLARHLTRTQLPGLSSLDQMYLLALANTVANTKLDFSDNHSADMAVRKGKLMPQLTAAKAFKYITN